MPPPQYRDSTQAPPHGPRFNEKAPDFVSNSTAAISGAVSKTFSPPSGITRSGDDYTRPPPRSSQVLGSARSGQGQDSVPVGAQDQAQLAQAPQFKRIRRDGQEVPVGQGQNPLSGQDLPWGGISAQITGSHVQNAQLGGAAGYGSATGADQLAGYVNDTFYQQRPEYLSNPPVLRSTAMPPFSEQTNNNESTPRTANSYSSSGGGGAPSNGRGRGSVK